VRPVADRYVVSPAFDPYAKFALLLYGILHDHRLTGKVAWGMYTSSRHCGAYGGDQMNGRIRGYLYMGAEVLAALGIVYGGAFLIAIMP